MPVKFGENETFPITHDQCQVLTLAEAGIGLSVLANMLDWK
jgi:hypothetical protein